MDLFSLTVVFSKPPSGGFFRLRGIDEERSGGERSQGGAGGGKQFLVVADRSRHQLVGTGTLSDAQWAAWKTYRQALHDLPTRRRFPADAVWPSAPTIGL